MGGRVKGEVAPKGKANEGIERERKGEWEGGRGWGGQGRRERESEREGGREGGWEGESWEGGRGEGGSEGGS